MEADVRQWVERGRAGDRAALECLIRRFDARVLNLAYRLTGDAEDARDLRQLGFLRAIQSLSEFDGRARFETWLTRIVINLCRDHVRSNVARRARQRVHEVERGDPTAAPPEEELLRSEASHAVAEALARLPDPEREVIVLRHYQDLPFPEIAQVLGAPVTTVKSRLERGFQRLRADLSPLSPLSPLAASFGSDDGDTDDEM